MHHWILYGVSSASRVNGTIEGSPGQLFPTTLGGEAFINGWAPGGKTTQMPKNVGLYMPHGAKATFRLEVHYNNLSGEETEGDRSGVDFCVTTKKREQEAATHWLGTANIRIPAKTKQDVASTCVPNITQGPVHIMSISPHMHQTGVHSKVQLKKKSGEMVSLIDEPFSFANQQNIMMPKDRSSDDVLVEPGDTLSTTCTFDNPTNSTINFGENTADEMCFFFTTAWPRGQLANGLFTIIPGAERAVSCLQ